MAPTAKLISDGFWDFSMRMPQKSEKKSEIKMDWVKLKEIIGGFLRDDLGFRIEYLESCVEDLGS